jgi:hypothetical protein
MARVLSLLLIFLLTGTVHAQKKAEPLVGKVKTSISRGVAYLISHGKETTS